jgi:DNA-binding NtrC family response regulator
MQGGAMNPTILVIDDEPVIQEVLEGLLETKGYFSHRCMNGKDAFKAMNEMDFNLVILDINLPDINGLEVADHLEMTHPDTPVIFITGEYSVESKTLEDECKGRADRHFIHKPITGKLLFAAVDKLVQVNLEKSLSH